MFITATEVKTNLGKYLMLAETRKILGKLFKDYAKSSIKVHEPSALIKLLEEENEAE